MCLSKNSSPCVCVYDISDMILKMTASFCEAFDPTYDIYELYDMTCMIYMTGVYMALK